MRVALVRWRAEQDGDLTTFVPDVDLDEIDAWGVIDLRGSGKAHQSSADGVALMVAPNLDTPIPGALIDLGDDHQIRLGTNVGRALRNRLGLNLVEATPGRIAAELLTLHARADDDSKPNPLVGERRFPRSKTDLRRRARVWCAGVLLYDELGAHVDEEMAYYAETFPTAGALVSSQDLPWESLNLNAAVVVGTFSGLTAAVSSSSVGVGVARTGVGVGSADMWASGSLWFFGNGFGGVGTVVRMSSSTGSAGYLGMISPSGGVRRIMLYRMASDRALTELAASPNLGTGGIPSQTMLELRTEANGSTIAAVYNSTAYGTTDTVITEGDRGGMCFDRGSSSQYRIYAFAMGQIGEGPGGGGTLVEGEGTAALGGLTATATGTVTVVGDATATLGALTGTATGTVQGVVTGTATADLGGLTAAATGVRSTTGTATGHLGGLTGTATGVRSTAGTATADLGGLTATATGTSQSVVTGTAAGQLGGLTATATGQKVVHGTATADLGGLDGHAVGEGATTVEGTATGNLGGLTATAAGVPTTHGTATGHLGGLTAAASGTVTVLGTAAAVLGGVTATAAGDVIVIGHATAQLSALAATATGQRRVVGTAVGNLGGLTAAVNIVTADPNPLSITIRETGHRATIREAHHTVTIKEQRR